MSNSRHKTRICSFINLKIKLNVSTRCCKLTRETPRWISFRKVLGQGIQFPGFIIIHPLRLLLHWLCSVCFMNLAAKTNETKFMIQIFNNLWQTMVSIVRSFQSVILNHAIIKSRLQINKSLIIYWYGIPCYASFNSSNN